MSFPRYQEYKESGVEWLGKVPRHWEVYKLQDLAKSERYSFVDGPFGSDLKNEEYTDSGIPLIQLNNINEGAHVLNSVKYVSAEKADQLGRHNAFPGDIAIAKMADPVARAAIVNGSFDRYVIVADCIRLSIEDTFAAPSFAVYAINSPYFRSHAVGLSSGITRLRINLGALKQIRLALPPLSEQTQIAAFLDRETAKIDGLVAEQRRLMALLKEKRQAVISHAVTRGLNPHAPLKPSGIEWLGDVPEHWEMVPLGMLATMIQTGPFGSQLHSSDYVDNGTPVINPSSIQEGKLEPDWSCSISAENVGRLSQHKLIEGDIVFGRRGEMGRCALVTANEVGWICGTGSLNVRLSARAFPQFVSIYLRTEYVREWLKLESVGSTMDNLNTQILGSISVPVPAVKEQKSIAAFLDIELAKFDTLTTEAQRAIDLLQERRTALISAAVTGQIDVRNTA